MEGHGTPRPYLMVNDGKFKSIYLQSVVWILQSVVIRLNRHGGYENLVQVIQELSSTPRIGILMLDTVFPRIPGDIGNPNTFPFPVQYHVVKGASPKRVVEEGDPELITPFVNGAKELESEGAQAIFTSCGFLALFHKELTAAVNVPVYSSSLLQIPLVQSTLGKGRQVGVITADSDSLTPRHFSGIGIDSPPVAIMGMQDSKEFASVFLGGKTTMDPEKCQCELIGAAKKLIETYPDVGAIVLECTNMPPYAKAIQQAVKMPIFDVVTLIHTAFYSICPLEHILPWK